MLPDPNSLYLEMRLACGIAAAIRDDEDWPPERLLQAVWQHQRIRRAGLRTVDGRSVQVLHPGFWNFEGGPDFRDALVQFGDEAPRSGDVEIDLRPSAWHGHSHDTNPNFRNVVLQVVWRAEKPAPKNPPLLELRPILDAPIGELSLLLGAESGRELPGSFRGKCAAGFQRMGGAQVDLLLEQAAEVRFAGKISWFQARARETDWGQSLWEGMFRALGYKHNSWPMQRVAELRSRWWAHGAAPLVLQARLLGIGGLLPDTLPGGSRPNSFMRNLWDCWWRDRAMFSDCILPREAWRFHGLRPANRPERRLALGAYWCADSSFVRRVQEWGAKQIPHEDLVDSLTELLRTEDDRFWNWHWTFSSQRLDKAHPLIGASRASDLAMNVLLPWLAARAAAEGREELLSKVRERYYKWPATEDNSVLKLARQRILAGEPARRLGTAAAQQGLMQIVRDFCEHSNSVCENCRLPDVVEKTASEAGVGL